MNRSRVIIIALLLIIVIGAVVALVVVNQQPAPQVASGGTNQGVQVAQEATATPLPTITPIPLIEVVIAVQDIPRGVPIAANAVQIVRIPEETAPFGAYSNIEDVVGLIARTDIFREQVVLNNLLVEDLSNLATAGSDAAAVLPANRVLVAVPIDRLTSVAYAIQPGDRVDIIASMLFVDVDPTFQSQEPNEFTLVGVSQIPLEGGGTSTEITTDQAIRGAFDSRLIPNAGTFPVLISPSEDPRPRLTTQTLIQDALVVWLGDFPMDGRIFRPAATPTPDFTPTPLPEGAAADGDLPPTPTPLPPRPDIISVGVTPQDAVVLTYLIESGIPMTFALRSAATTSLPQTDAVTLNYIMERYRILVPEKFNYALEPAIRSIRSIEVADRIQLLRPN